MYYVFDDGLSSQSLVIVQKNVYVTHPEILLHFTGPLYFTAKPPSQIRGLEL